MDALSPSAARAARYNIGPLRINEITSLFRFRYGTELPDDDAGHEDLLFMFEQMAWLKNPRRRMENFAELWAPWLSPRELNEQISFTLAHPPVRYNADQAASRLGLAMADRQALRIKTIGAVDCDAGERAKRRNERKAIQRKEKRQKERDAQQATDCAVASPAIAFLLRLKAEERKPKREQKKRLARAWAVVEALSDGKTRTCNEITQIVKALAAFKGIKDEFRKAVRRAIDDLRDHGAVEAKKLPALRGEALHVWLLVALGTEKRPP